MKLLLTSNGLSNSSIAKGFIELIGKNPQDSKVAFIPTAGMVEEGDKDWLINDLSRIKKLGFYLDIVDLAQLRKNEWLKRLEDCDAIFVGGGNTFYLSYWMEKSGFFAELPKLLESKVYAGISAGSMIVTPSLRVTSQVLSRDGKLADEEYSSGFGPPGRSSSKTTELVPFLVRPHFNSRVFFENNHKFVEKVTKDLAIPIYVIDDQTAIKVIDDKVEMVSEGKWERFN
jgi:dipeptidase E